MHLDEYWREKELDFKRALILQITNTDALSDSQREEIADMILSEIQRGVTGLQARGMYSGREKTMLFCVVSKKEIVQLKERINEIDPGAFVIVSDAREVHGEGFIEKK